MLQHRLQTGLARQVERAPAAERAALVHEDVVRVQKQHQRPAAQQELVDLKQRPFVERLLRPHHQHAAQSLRHLPFFQQQAAVGVFGRYQLEQVGELRLHHVGRGVGVGAPAVGRRLEVGQVAHFLLSAKQVLESVVQGAANGLRIGDLVAHDTALQQVHGDGAVGGGDRQAGVGQLVAAVGRLQLQRRQTQPGRLLQRHRLGVGVDVLELQAVEVAGVELLDQALDLRRDLIHSRRQHGQRRREVEPHRDVLLQGQQAADALGETGDRLGDGELQLIGGGNRRDGLDQVAVNQRHAGVGRTQRHLVAVELLDLDRIDQVLARQFLVGDRFLLPHLFRPHGDELIVEQLTAVHRVLVQQVAHRLLHRVVGRRQVGGEEGADGKRLAQRGNRVDARRRQGVEAALGKVEAPEQARRRGDVDHHHGAEKQRDLQDPQAGAQRAAPHMRRSTTRLVAYRLTPAALRKYTTSRESSTPLAMLRKW